MRPYRAVSGVLTLFTTAALLATAAPAAAEPAPGTYSGPGFDACTAPSEATMNAWLSSPYRAVGIYFGGINRGCTQANLTATWVANVQAAGWHLMPLYVGLQAPCTTSSKTNLIIPASRAAQGRAAAEDAVAQARALGLPRESVLIYDMEAYRTDDATCRTAVQTFISAWTSRLHDLSYLSGFYSSIASGVADQVAVYRSGSHVHPDVLDFARWDNVATVSDPAIPAAYWSPQRRIKQYRGDHVETWGGVSINIDNDLLDVAPLPTTPFGDVNGNGWADLMSRNSATGALNLYPGNGSYVANPTVVGTSWNSMSAITRHGDFDGAGFEDVLARQANTGDLWLYPRTATGFRNRRLIGTSWNTMRELTATGDLDRDGRNDLLAVHTATGTLRAYPGTGAGFRNPVALGRGWNTMDELTGIGDLDRDGNVDLIARHIASGDLYFYPGRGLGFAPRVRVGTGWTGMRDLVGVGDLDRDGSPDMLAIQTSTNYLLRYSGQGAGLAAPVRIGSSWGSHRPLF
jgi:hypothetical protein